MPNENILNDSPGKVILLVAAFVLPPLPIFLLQDYNIFTREFLVAVILTVLGHIPGTIFAVFYILVEYPKVYGRRQAAAGYLSVPGDVENQIENEEQTPSGEREPFRDQHDQEEHQQFTDTDNAANETNPPSYEAVAGSSTGEAHTVSDIKLNGDNKVQQ